MNDDATTVKHLLITIGGLIGLALIIILVVSLIT
jgi:hypothetical protein